MIVVPALETPAVVAYAPQGHWKTITFVGGLRQRGMTAPFVLEGAMNGPMFLAYVKQCLAPTLTPTSREAIEGAGATVIYLPK